MSDRNTSPAFAVGGNTEKWVWPPVSKWHESTDEDYKRLFGDKWQEAKADAERIARMPFPDGFDATDILEP